ncbi:MAG: Selenocysteine-specific elongation factor [Phycisphaerales bacterium]|nr:Selenocysteine-specific elongation factor [Phycisphaerales bacterium]
MTAVSRHFVLATAGHVDHGKSAIVYALTGTEPDRLPEEKQRGMTIDLGFAQLKLLANDGSPIDVGLVDVPGHEDFIKNMVAGIGAVDAAMLVVAADDGAMPQTREHLQILAYAGVTRGVVVLSKIDLCDDVARAAAALRQSLAGTPLAHAPIIPTSTRTGNGIDTLRRVLAEVLSAAPAPADWGKPRLAVDRAFSVRGSGTVVTGTLIGGQIHRGQSVVVRPAGMILRVRGLQSHHQKTDTAMPGTRVAMNLPDIALASADQAGPTIGRGDVVTGLTVGRVSDVIDAFLWRSTDAASPLTDVIRDGLTVKVHHDTAAVMARMQFAGDGSPIARLKLERPIYSLTGDRFVLRSVSEQHTLAGGIVLDAAPPLHKRGSFRADALQQALLLTRAAAPMDAEVAVLSAVERDGVVDLDALSATLPHADEQLIAICDALAERHLLRKVMIRFMVSPPLWQATFAAARDAVLDHHRTHPQQHGLAVPEVRRIVRSVLPAAATEGQIDGIADATVAELCRNGFSRTATVLHQAGHHPALPPRLQAAGDAILDVLRSHPFDPPSSKEICRTDAMAEAMKFLIATGRAVDLGQHTVLSADAYAMAIERIRAQLSVTGSATVSELKTTLGSSRRIMVPLLERLDRDRVTRRNGDARSLA